MNEADDNETKPVVGPAQFAAKQFFIKWGLISFGVLVLLVVAESVLVEIGGQAASGGRQSFESYGDFIKYQESRGYLFLGRFRDRWPADISEERAAMHEISFELSDGTQHTYPGFHGYELKLIRLATPSGDEGVVVLRSQNKRPY